MKLGEALSNRKDLLTQANNLVGRATSCVLVEKGEAVEENPLEYMGKVKELLTKYEELSVLINKANNDHGIMEMTATRDTYRNMAQHYRTIAQAGQRISRYGRDEIVFVPSFDVKEALKLADDYAAAARRLDVQIQETDWTVEI